MRLERVFRWLADHLDDAVDLATLADVACLSPYHFHRVYHSMQGETVTDTVRRLRLHRAAVELITGELPVQRIARRAGYGSQEAFTRAFKTAYGVPPARIARRSSPIPDTEQTGGRDGNHDDLRGHDSASRRRSESRRSRIAASTQKIGTTFERLSAMAGGHNLFGPTTRSFGIYYDDLRRAARGAALGCVHHGARRLDTERRAGAA